MFEEGELLAEEYRRTDEEFAQGIGNGIRAGKTARNAVIAAGKAASGDFAGAAIDIFKDDNLRTLIAFLLAISFFILFCVIFVVPMSVYEGLQGYVDNLTEQWKVDYYSGDSGRFISFLKATAGLISNVAGDLWNRIKESGTGAEDTDRVEDADLNVVSVKQDLLSVYSRKIQAGKDKITARQKTIIDSLTQDARRGQISSIMYGRFVSEYKGNYYEYDVHYNTTDGTIQSKKVNVYDGCEVVAINRTITDTDSLKLLCLYTAQEGNSIESIRLSGFMKWLGYNGSNNRRLEYNLGENENISYSIPSWTGGFMPQYLEDEAAKTKQAYRDHGAALTDLLIQIDCPNLLSIQASVSEELKTDAGTAYKWITDYTKPIYEENLSYEDRSDGATKTQSYSNGHDSPEAELPKIVGYEQKQVLYSYDISYIHVKYIIPVTVSCRDINQILDAAGLWSGFLPEEKSVLDGSYLRSNASVTDRKAG